MTLTIKQVSKITKIYPRTNKALAAWDIASIVTRDFHIKQICYGIAYAIQTGRLNTEATLDIKKMTSYQGLKLFVRVVNNCQVPNDVARFINRLYS